jgi:hypothetical protein
MVIFICGILSAKDKPNKDKNDINGVDLPTVVKAVNEALVEAQDNNVKGFPDLTNVTLSVSGTAAKSVGGKVTFLVFSFGPSVEFDNAMTLNVKLNAPSTTSRIELSAFSETELKTALARAINAAKVAYLQVVTALASAPTLSKLIPSVDFEVKFTVQKSISGGVTIANILPIGLEVNGKVAATQVQSVKLSFGK